MGKHGSVILINFPFNSPKKRETIFIFIGVDTEANWCLVSSLTDNKTIFDCNDLKKNSNVAAASS